MCWHGTSATPSAARRRRRRLAFTAIAIITAGTRHWRNNGDVQRRRGHRTHQKATRDLSFL